jgi:predicted ATP-grasp superfamily ATP-dependent carboligase
MVQTEMEIEIKEDIHKTNTLIVAIPDAGLVSVITAGAIIEQHDLKEIGEIKAHELRSVIVLEEGFPKSPIRFFGSDKVHILKADIPIGKTTRIGLDFSNLVVSFAKDRYENLFYVSGIPDNQRSTLKIDDLEIYGITTSNDYIKQIESLENVKRFKHGAISGTYASLIATAAAEKFPIQAYYVSSFPNFPDPLASARVMKDVLNPILKLDLKIEELIEKGDQLQLQFRKLASQTKQMLRQSQPSPTKGLYI